MHHEAVFYLVSMLWGGNACLGGFERFHERFRGGVVDEVS